EVVGAPGTLAVIGDLTQSFGTVAGGATSDPAAADNSMLRLSSFPTQSTENKTHGIELRAGTLGRGNIALVWDQLNSATASRYWRVLYSTNGTDFIDHQLISNRVASSWTRQVVSFAALPGVDHNPSFAFRIVSEFAPASLPGGTE